MMPEWKVIRTDFEHLEKLLNSGVYPNYHIHQILAEHCYDGANAVVILKKDGEW